MEEVLAHGPSTRYTPVARDLWGHGLTGQSDLGPLPEGVSSEGFFWMVGTGALPISRQFGFRFGLPVPNSCFRVRPG